MTVTRAGERLEVRGLVAVAHHGRRVPREADAGGPRHRGAVTELFERRRVEREQIAERATGPLRRGLEALVDRRGRAAATPRRARARAGIERADRLTVVAAEQVAPDAFAERLGYRVAVLDGEVGNAAPRSR